MRLALALSCLALTPLPARGLRQPRACLLTRCLAALGSAPPAGVASSGHPIRSYVLTVLSP